MWGDQGLLECYSLIARQNRLAYAKQAVTVAHRGRHMGDLEAARFPLLFAAAEVLEGLMKKGLDVVRLQAPCVSAFHVGADALHLACVHGIGCQRMVIEQILQVAAVQRGVEHRGEECLRFRQLAEANGFDQQFAQRFALELELAQHVEHLATQGLARLFELLQQPEIDITFTCAFGHQVPQVAGFGLADTVDAPEALFNAVRVPGQVVIDHQVRALEVDAFARRVCRQ